MQEKSNKCVLLLLHLRTHLGDHLYISLRVSILIPVPIPIAIAVPISIPIRRRQRSMLVSSFVLIVRFSTLLCIFPFIHAVFLHFSAFFPPLFPDAHFFLSCVAFPAVSRCRTLIARQWPTHAKVAYPFFRCAQIAGILFFAGFFFTRDSDEPGTLR